MVSVALLVLEIWLILLMVGVLFMNDMCFLLLCSGFFLAEKTSIFVSQVITHHKGIKKCTQALEKNSYH